jgi:hypothetical protein
MNLLNEDYIDFLRYKVYASFQNQSPLSHHCIVETLLFHSVSSLVNLAHSPRDVFEPIQTLNP